MKKYLSIALVVSIAYVSSVKAQQNVQFTQYMYNTLAVNPAYAGSRGVLNASALGRFQWVGIDGAPTTQTVYVHSPLPNENMGLGFSVTNDKIGPTNNTYIVGSYSYTIKLNETGSKLSFGASAGANLLSLNYTSYKQGGTPGNESEGSLNNISTKVKPNFGFGAYYHTDKFYTGISAPKLLQNKILANTTNAYQENRHFYWICGGIFTLNDMWKFKPTSMVKVTANAPISIDLTANFLFADKLWLGVGHRLRDSFSALLGYKFTDQLQAGYAFDQTISKLSKVNSGSHEIYLSYDFVFNKAKMKSPRYF
jgi:type IX secretion system PorP/SprF family membrane protein